MGMVHLTKRLIDHAKYEGKKKKATCVLWDDKIPGFGVRIYPSGKKSFMVKYRLDGRQRNMILGQYGRNLTLDQARDMAREKLAEVNKGDDPLSKKHAKYKAPTIEDLTTEYLENHAKKHKRSWRNDESQIDRLIVPAWGKRKVSSIRRADVVKLHRRIGENNGKYQANRTLATISKMFELAVKWAMLEEGAPNPARGVEKFKEEKRHRAIDLKELPQLAKAIDAEESPYIRAAIWLLLYIGCRKNELLTAKWDQVDFDKRIMTFPVTKAGRSFSVPLSGPAIEILRSLPREEGNPHVIPGRRTGQHLVNLMKPWQRILERAKLPKTIRLHDLRHTLGSSLSDAGTSLTIVGAALNHSQPSVTARYALPTEDPVRKALEDHAARLEAVLKDQEAEVIPLMGTATE